MRVLAVLWTVCLVRLCSADCCGGGTTDDNDSPQGPKPVTTTPNTLDLSNPDNKRISAHKADDNGVEHDTYYPKNGSVTSVVEGGTTLWTASGDEECVLAKVLSRGDSSLLLIFITHGENSSKKHFEKNANGVWVLIEKEEFEKKLNGMRNGVTNQSSPSEEPPVIQPAEQADGTTSTGQPESKKKASKK